MAYSVILPPGAAHPDNPAWHEARRAGVSASEIAAVLGISPWESPFSLYWRKVNGWEVEETEEMATGRRLEPVICDWAADTIDPSQNLLIAPAGLYASVERPWQLATPDRLVCLPGGTPVAVVESKWTGRWDGWGEPLTADIPVYYRSQILQQLDVLDLEDGWLPVLGPGGFRMYRIRRDPKDIRVLRAGGAAFARQLADSEPPDIDSHSATVATQQRLYDKGEGDIEVPVDLAEGYRRARALRARADSIVDGYETRIREALADRYDRAVCGVDAKGKPRLVASRSIYDQSSDQAELTALEDDWPTVDRLNPGRAKSYA